MKDIRPIPHSRPMIGRQELEATAAVLQSGMLVGGDQPIIFKDLLSELCGGQSVECFSSGRSALRAALTALALPKGSHVVVQTYVCDAVPWAIRAAGLRPKFCDIGRGWTAGAEEISAVLDESCSAIIAAPPFGLLQSVSSIRSFNLPIVHDLCQASPAAIGAAEESDLGDLVVLSFHPTKYVCAAGGGAVVDVRGRYVDCLKELAAVEFSSAPFSDLQAALGSAQLSQIERFKTKRSQIFRSLVGAAPAQSSEKLLAEIDVDDGHMFRLPFTIGALPVKIAFERLSGQGISARHGVDQLSHRGHGLNDALFPNSLAALDSTISVPFYPALDEHEIERIAQCLEILA